MNQLPVIPGLTITSSGQILSPATRLAMLLVAPPGYGKTKLAGSLDKLCQKYDGRRCLYIPVEQSEGVGAVTIRKLDLPLFQPKSLSDAEKALGTLKNDKTFAGIVLDSSTELVKQFVIPESLKFPPKENHATRAVGVPTRSDYGTIGSITSSFMRRLLAMSVHEKPEYRKHIIITATLAEKEDDDGRVTWRGPELPGRMAGELAAAFQINAMIKIKPEVKDGKRHVSRYLVTKTDGVDAVKDRFEVLPAEIKIEEPDGEDLCSIWEKYFLPAMKRE